VSPASTSQTTALADAMVEAFEKQLLMQALVKSGGVKSKAANLLHMNRTTLVEKVKKLRLEHD
jgi:DNA-binding NtrC family response regulator